MLMRFAGGAASSVCTSRTVSRGVPGGGISRSRDESRIEFSEPNLTTRESTLSQRAMRGDTVI